MSEINTQSDTHVNIINKYLRKQLSSNNKSYNENIDKLFKKINLLKSDLKRLIFKNNLENIMKIKIKIYHHNIQLNKLIYESENNYLSLDDFVKKNKIKFRVLIHIFKCHIQKYFIKHDIKNYAEQLILDTATAVIDKQLGKAPSICSLEFVKLIETLCNILSQIEYNFDLSKKIKQTEDLILKYPLFVGGNRNVYNINYTL